MYVRLSSSRQRRAATIVVVAVIIPVLLGMAALTIDVGHLYRVRAELQRTADAAALAGAGMLPDVQAARAVAHQFAVLNSPDDGTVLADADLQLGDWDAGTAVFTPGGANPNAVRAITRQSSANGNPVDLFFASILGVQQADVPALATASFIKGGAWDVVIAQDVTGSFKNELDEARVADQGLLDCLRDNTSGDSQFGIVGFTGYGTVLAPLQTIDAGYNQLSQTISSIDKCGRGSMPPCSGTNIGAGLDAAIGLLAGLATALPPAIILVSDGEPNSSIPGFTDEDLRDWAVASADAADAAGISIFAVFYSDSGGNNGAAFVESLIRGDGTFHNAPDPDNIAENMAEICMWGIPIGLVQ